MRQLATEWLYNELFPNKLDGFSEEEWGKIDTAFKQAKQKEIENLEDALTSALSKAFLACQDGYDITTKEIINDIKETYGIDK